MVVPGCLDAVHRVLQIVELAGPALWPQRFVGCPEVVAANALIRLSKSAHLLGRPARSARSCAAPVRCRRRWTR